MAIEINGYKFWFDNYFKSNLDIILNKAIPNKWDALLIFHGMEGSGKTTLATQTALYLDPLFNLSKCVYTPDEFKTCIDQAKSESSILWDEAITGANVATHANNIQVSIVSKLTQIRKKKLKILLCFPYINMLQKYFINRCAASIYVYARGYDDRGYGFFYNKMQTEILYALVKDKYKYNYYDGIKNAKRAFYFKFAPTFCLPEDDYDTKKENARIQLDNNGNQDKYFLPLVKLLIYNKEKLNLSYKKQSDRLGIPQSTLVTWVSKCRDNLDIPKIIG